MAHANEGRKVLGFGIESLQCECGGYLSKLRIGMSMYFL